MTSVNRISQAIVRSSIVWGMLVSVGFFTLLHAEVLLGLPGGDYWQTFFLRYTAGHEIEYVETGMFFIGLAALVVKAMETAAQRKLSAAPMLGPTNGQTAADAAQLLERLDQLPDGAKGSYLARRLASGVEHVRDSGSAESLDEHLKYLVDCDAARANSSYAFVRLLIWAIPIMGFLGTVVGITMAIANLSPTALEQSLPDVTHGLGVAFDTTALALVLATILMFVQYLVDGQEGKLLDAVERAAGVELCGRFERSATGGDPSVAAVRRMAEAMLKSSEQVVHRQAKLWQETIDAAHQRWSETATSAQKQLETALAGALNVGLAAHARQISAAGAAAAEQSQKHWGHVQESFDKSAQTMATQQSALAKQGDLLLKAIEGTGQVARLEESLNRNLAALAGGHNFEEAIESLAAVIHLLNARLSHSGGAFAVNAHGDLRAKGQAA